MNPLFIVEKIKEAVAVAASHRFSLCLSEADVSLIVSSHLRELGLTVKEQHPMIPTVKLASGTPVHLHARRADLAVFYESLMVLVELKVAAKVDDQYRAQAQAYGRIGGCTSVLAVVDRGRDAVSRFEIYDPDGTITTDSI